VLGCCVTIGDDSRVQTSTNPAQGRPGEPPAFGPARWQRTELGNRVQLFWLLCLGTVLVLQLQLPFRLAGLALSLAGIWFGCVVLVRLARARRLGRPARRAWPIGVGLGLVSVMLLSFVSDAVFYPIVSDREQCVAGANTQAAKRQCLDQAENRLRKLVQDIGNTTFSTR
jgi:hypothetical protein